MTALTRKIRSMKTDRSVLTVKTQIRLLLKKQSDQGLLCLPFHLFLLDALHQYKMKQFQGQLIIFRGPNFQNSCGMKMCKALSLIYQQPLRLSFVIALVPSYMNSSTYQHLFQNNLIQMLSMIRPWTTWWLRVLGSRSRSMKLFTGKLSSSPLQCIHALNVMLFFSPDHCAPDKKG